MIRIASASKPKPQSRFDRFMVSTERWCSNEDGRRPPPQQLCDAAVAAVRGRKISKRRRLDLLQLDAFGEPLGTLDMTARKGLPQSDDAEIDSPTTVHAPGTPYKIGASRRQAFSKSFVPCGRLPKRSGQRARECCRSISNVSFKALANARMPKRHTETTNSRGSPSSVRAAERPRHVKGSASIEPRDETRRRIVTDPAFDSRLTSGLDRLRRSHCSDHTPAKP